tara:strand:+ start:10077 stop:10445 length:369 start_codon:yes stop_codon:yes gene_type:complete
MKKISFLTIIFTGFIFLANSQELKFNEREFDFGEIKEMDGKVSHKFVFTNNSKKSIQILTVKPSCGCTTPDWSKKEVKPGKEGFIVAEYNPKGRPGVFRKSLSVVTSDNKRSVIFIKGKVSR